MGIVQIVDPRGEVAIPEVVPNERPASLDGQRVGIIMDGPWRSWFVFSEYMEHVLNEHGVETKRLSMGSASLVDSEGLDLSGVAYGRDEATLNSFAEDVDLVVVGLGN
jgi:hypothetical protein